MCFLHVRSGVWGCAVVVVFGFVCLVLDVFFVVLFFCGKFLVLLLFFFFFSSRRRHTRWPRDWSSDVCSSDLASCARSACASWSECASASPVTCTTTLDRRLRRFQFSAK